jgi:hypothetical protein
MRRRERSAYEVAALFYVVAQGNIIRKLGRTCFSRKEADAMAADLRSRGYADAAVHRWEGGP